MDRKHAFCWPKIQFYIHALDYSCLVGKGLLIAVKSCQEFGKHYTVKQD
jgi:hypothetical protein